MPTTNKRINLTIPDILYEKIQAYKEENGIQSDAAACTQLISAQLRALQNSKQMLEAMKKFSADDLKALSDIGLDQLISLRNQSENG